MALRFHESVSVYYDAKAVGAASPKEVALELQKRLDLNE